MSGQVYKRYLMSVTAVEPLHIGAAPNPLTEVAGAVVRVGERLTIPGPGLKGAYRSALEYQLIEEVVEDLESARPCIPATYSNLSADEKALLRGGVYSGENCGYPGRDSRPLCPTCYLLGTMGLVGFVRVPYLVAQGLPEEGYSVRYDRALDSAVHSANREFQYVEPGAVFSGTLEVLLHDSIRGWELGKPRALASKRRSDRWLEERPLTAAEMLATYVEKPLESIRILGGFRSKGFGGVSVSLQAVEA